MSRLGTTQLRILRTLARRPNNEAPPTAAEIVEGWLVLDRDLRYRQTMETENVQNCLRRLHGRGLVEKLGTSTTNARCWAITPAGREALGQVSS